MENINMTMTLALTVVSGIEAMLGFFQFKASDCTVRRRYNGRLFKIVAFVATVWLSVMFIVYCGGAAVERMVVILEGDSSPLWAPVAVAMLLQLAVVIMFGFFQAIGYNVGQWQQRRLRLLCKSR